MNDQIYLNLGSIDFKKLKHQFIHYQKVILWLISLQFYSVTKTTIPERNTRAFSWKFWSIGSWEGKITQTPLIEQACTVVSFNNKYKDTGIADTCRNPFTYLFCRYTSQKASMSSELALFWKLLLPASPSEENTRGCRCKLRLL